MFTSVPPDRPQRTPLRRSAPPILPTLFDRLSDDFPSEPSEPASAYTLTQAGLKDQIRRDLGFLLDTVNAFDLIDPVAHPQAWRSGLNFGVPPVAGAYQASGQWDAIEMIIRRAIAVFEPRLLLDTVRVVPVGEAGDGAPDGSGGRAHGGRGNTRFTRFEIRAQVAAQPYPLEFTVQGEVDLETRRMGGFIGA